MTDLESLEVTVEELRSLVRAQGDEIHRLRRELSGGKTSIKRQPGEGSTPKVTRGGLLKTATAVGLASIGMEALTHSVSANTGDNLVLGQTNVADHVTVLDWNGAGSYQGVIFLANDTVGFSGSVCGYPAALGGWAGNGPSGVPHGIYGYTTAPSGYGVIGFNSGAGGVGVSGIAPSGSSGVLGQVGQSKPALALSGVYGVSFASAGVRGEARDSSGSLAVGSGVVGSAGADGGIAVLGQANGVDPPSPANDTALGNIGVLGVSSNTGTAVFGLTSDAQPATSPTNIGVYGLTNFGSGVVGESRDSQGALASGTGVTGVSNRGYGVYGISTDSAGVTGLDQGDGYGVSGGSRSGTGVSGQGGAYGGVFEGLLAPLLLAPSSQPGQPTGSHRKGELYVDSNGILFSCIADGTPGTWRPLSSVVPVPNIRVLNTRPSHKIGPFTGPIANNQLLTLPLAGTNGIPADATGVIGNLTAADATGICFLALVPSGANHLGVSSVNFPVQQQGVGVANAFTVGLGTGGAVDIFTGNCSAYTVNIILDVTGYIV